MFWPSGISPSSVRYAFFKGQFLCTKLSTSLDDIQIQTSSLMGRGFLFWNIHMLSTQSPNKTNLGKLWRYLTVHGLTCWRKGNTDTDLALIKTLLKLQHQNSSSLSLVQPRRSLENLILMYCVMILWEYLLFLLLVLLFVSRCRGVFCNDLITLNASQDSHQINLAYLPWLNSYLFITNPAWIPSVPEWFLASSYVGIWLMKDWLAQSEHCGSSFLYILKSTVNQPINGISYHSQLLTGLRSPQGFKSMSCYFLKSAKYEWKGS